MNRGDTMYKHKGYWWTGNMIKMIELDGKIYALDGWNGEKYFHCWECKDEFDAVDDREYVVRPIYKEIAKDRFEIIDYVLE